MWERWTPTQHAPVEVLYQHLSTYVGVGMLRDLEDQHLMVLSLQGNQTNACNTCTCYDRVRLFIIVLAIMY